MNKGLKVLVGGGAVVGIVGAVAAIVSTDEVRTVISKKIIRGIHKVLEREDATGQTARDIFIELGESARIHEKQIRSESYKFNKYGAASFCRDGAPMNSMNGHYRREIEPIAPPTREITSL